MITVEGVLTGERTPLCFLLGERASQRYSIDKVLARHGALVIQTAWPLVLLLAPWHRAPASSNLRIAGLLFVSFLIPEAIYVAWRQYRLASAHLDRLLAGHQSQEQMARGLRRWLATPPQAWSVVIGAAALSTICWSVRLAEPSPFAVAAVVVAGAAVGQAFYLNTLTVLLGLLFRDLNEANVLFANPIATPGFAYLNRAVQAQARAGLALLAAVSLPLTYAYVGRHTVGATVSYLVLMALAAGSVLIIGISVQVWLSEPVRRERLRLLCNLSAEIEDCRAALMMGDEGAAARLKVNLDLFQQLTATSYSFLGSGSLLRYAAAAVPIAAQLVAVGLTAGLRK